MFDFLFEKLAQLLDNWWYIHIAVALGSLFWVAFMKGSLRSVAKFFIYLSVFSVVIVMYSTFFPFIGGKYYFFRVSVELAVIFALLWWGFEAEKGELSKRLAGIYTKPLFIAISFFVLAFLLASVFALDPHAAFWSNFERGEGGFQMIHYYVFFVLLLLFFESREDWEMMFAASLGAATLMILYGVAGVTGWADSFITPVAGDLSHGFWVSLTQPRFQGSLGNPAYVAPYLMFSIFYAAYLWCSKKLKNTWGNASLFGGLIIFFLFFFLLSQTRGALLGLGAYIFAFLVYAVFSMGKFRRQAVALLVAVVVIGGTLVYFKDSPFVKRLPGGRIFDISFSDQTVNTRLWTWGSAWSGFRERPMLGWGPENFSAAFDKYFDPRHFIPWKNSETWFDRAHSVVFDYLAETGALGLLAYISMFVVFYWETWRVSKRRDAPRGEPGHALIRAAFFCLPIGYLVQGLAIFDVLPIYINLFLFFAFSCHYFYFRPTGAKQ